MKRFYLAVILCLMSCDDPFDADSLAEDYCDCMTNNGALKDFEEASKICDERIVTQNRYIRLWTIEMNDPELDKFISNETRDSVTNFIGRFTKYTNTHCCRETLACP